MTDERKVELYNKMLGYFTELVSDQNELVRLLMNIGFTKQELEYEDILKEVNNMNDKIREWYLRQYPTDELGIEINKNITFYDLFVVLDTYKDVYEALSVYDSIVRERVFEELANRMKVDYDYVYEQCLRA